MQAFSTPALFNLGFWFFLLIPQTLPQYVENSLERIVGAIELLMEIKKTYHSLLAI